MKYLKNWENKTWLSSKKYILSFCKFLKSKKKINRSTRILDIGCGRGNIISYLNKKYKFFKKPIGVDIFKSEYVKKNIIFKKEDAIKFLKNSNELFDLILIKQTIHFFNKKDIGILLSLAKKHLSKKGKIFIVSLEASNGLPTFKKMGIELDKSMKLDKQIIKIVKKKLTNYKEVKFKFKVIISKKKYLEMLKNKYISCLIDLSQKDIRQGQQEIKSKYKINIQFYDILNCLIYKS